MKLTGKIQVFKNRRGYYTGYLTSYDDLKPVGKVFIDVILSVDMPSLKEYSEKLDAGKTLKLDVKEGYLNAVHVKDFDKLSISVLKAELCDVFPKEGK